MCECVYVYMFLLVVCVFSLIALEDEDMEITLPVRCLQVFWHFFLEMFGTVEKTKDTKTGTDSPSTKPAQDQPQLP